MRRREASSSQHEGAARILTLDAGNSRIKLAVWSDSVRAGSEPLECVVWQTGPDAAAKVLVALGEGFAGCATAMSVTAGAARRQELAEALKRATGRMPLIARHLGLKLEYETPDTLGSDRTCAARGAVELIGMDCIVVDAGTALTVDAVRWSGGSPEFLGGSISPGPELFAEALARRGADLPMTPPRVGAHALGRTTRAALEGGIGVGFRGAATGLVEAVARESGLHDAAVVLTGGAHRHLLEPTPFTSRVLRVDEWLVHRGLLWLLRTGADG